MSAIRLHWPELAVLLVGVLGVALVCAGALAPWAELEVAVARAGGAKFTRGISHGELWRAAFAAVLLLGGSYYAKRRRRGSPAFMAFAMTIPIGVYFLGAALWAGADPGPRILGVTAVAFNGYQRVNPYRLLPGIYITGIGGALVVLAGVAGLLLSFRQTPVPPTSTEAPDPSSAPAGST